MGLGLEGIAINAGPAVSPSVALRGLGGIVLAGSPEVSPSVALRGLGGIVLAGSPQVSPSVALRGLAGIALYMQRSRIDAVFVSIAGLPKTAVSWQIADASLRRGAEIFALSFAPGALQADETGIVPASGAWGGFTLTFSISGVYDDASVFSFSNIEIQPALAQAP